VKFETWEAIRKRPWSPYVVAVIGPIIITIFRLIIHPVQPEDGLGLSFYGLPVIAAALLGGFRPGIVCTLLGVFMGTYFFVAPTYNLLVTNPRHVFSIISFSLTFTTLSLVSDLFLSREKREKQALIVQRESETRLANLLQRISDGVFALDRNCNVQFANRAFLEMVNSDLQTLQQNPIWEAFGPNNRRTIQSAIQAANSSQDMVAIEISVANPARWLQLKIFPSENRETLAVHVQDITAQVELGIAREKLLLEERTRRSDAERESKSKDDFLATLSHELRTPMTSILGWSEFLVGKNFQDPDLIEGLNSIERSAKQQASLIDDLLDVSRIVTGNLRIHWEVIDLREVIQDVVREQTPRSASFNKQLIAEIGEDEVWVRADEIRMYQIFTNLVNNAFKFTPATDGCIWIKLKTDDDNAIVTVRDNGQGIEPEHLTSIFDRFRQIGPTRGRKTGGLGLGLAIVHQLVQAHGGTVYAESEGLGKGSKFTVKIPLLDLTSLPVTEVES
jgi:PAS domain S-box-containing protein